MLQNYTTARPLAISSTFTVRDSKLWKCSNVFLFCFVLFLLFLLFLLMMLFFSDIKFPEDKINTGTYSRLPYRRTLGSFTYAVTSRDLLRFSHQIAVERQTFVVLSAISSKRASLVKGVQLITPSKFRDIIKPMLSFRFFFLLPLAANSQVSSWSLILITAKVKLPA